MKKQFSREDIRQHAADGGIVKCHFDYYKYEDDTIMHWRDGKWSLVMRGENTLDILAGVMADCPCHLLPANYTPGHYLHGYPIVVFMDKDTHDWIAVPPDLPTVSGVGATPTEAIEDLEDAIQCYLDYNAKSGYNVREPWAWQSGGAMLPPWIDCCRDTTS